MTQTVITSKNVYGILPIVTATVYLVSSACLRQPKLPKATRKEANYFLTQCGSTIQYLHSSDVD